MKIEVPLWHLPLVGLLPGCVTFSLWNLLPNHPQPLVPTLFVPALGSLFILVYTLFARWGKVKMNWSHSQRRKAFQITVLPLLIPGLGLLTNFGIACFVGYAFLACYAYYMNRLFNFAVYPLLVGCSLLASVAWLISAATGL